MPNVTDVFDDPYIAPVEAHDAISLRVRESRAKPRGMPVGRLFTAQARTP